MALRAPRVLTAAVAGGLLTGSLLLGAGSAVAAPSSDDDVVEARCGETVRAEPEQTVKVIPELGLPFEREVRRGMDPITDLVGGLLCRVQVDVVEPVSEQVERAVPPAEPLTEGLREGTGAILDPEPETTTTTPSSATTTTPEAAVPTFTPQQEAAAAPAFGPAFAALPSSFLRSATGPAPGVRAYDPDMLLGSAFPGLRAGAPTSLGYDTASAVTTASQVQALPVDGLSEGGVGVPALVAVLALSGVAAFTVRRIVLGRASTEAAAAADATDATDAADSADSADSADDTDPTDAAGSTNSTASAAPAGPADSTGSTGPASASGAANEPAEPVDSAEPEEARDGEGAVANAAGRAPVPA